MKKLIEHLIMIAIIAVFAAMMAGCNSVRNKSLATAGTVSAIKIESTGSTASGTLMPNLLLGGSAFAYGSSPTAEVDSGRLVTRPIYAHAERSSFLDKIFGLGVSDSATVYIGVPGETADETATRLNALRTAPTATETQRQP